MVQVLGGIILLVGAIVVCIFCLSLMVMGSVFAMILGALTLVVAMIEKIQSTYNWIVNRKEVSWTRK